MTDLKKLLIEAREYIADMVKLAEHYGAKLEDRHAEKQLLARIDAALAEKVEPVAIGEVKESGVVWANQNPHAYPIGTKFYAALPEADK